MSHRAQPPDSTELFRALAILSEPPGGATRRIAELLDLGPPPSEADFADLFLFQLPPYASVYLGPEGQLGGEARDRVAGFFRTLGAEPPGEPDHLATLLAFYAGFAELEGGGAPRDRVRHARRAFLWEHLLSWLPAYLAKLAEIATPPYRRWGGLLGQALGREAGLLSEPGVLPLHLRAAPPLADPRREGGDLFLASLLAPVRSGLLLVRADLNRLAADRGLGSRLGERRFVLRALLAQDAAATLDWLAEEADRWTRLHRRPGAPAPTIAGFWSARAAATARLLREVGSED